MTGETRTIQQRTCNIIMCCKMHCKLLDDSERYTYENAIIAYLSKECACPVNYYKTHFVVVDRIMLEALYDYLNCTRNPGYAMRQVFENTWFNPDLNASLFQRICSMFAQIQVRDDDGCINGFTEDLIHQSDIDLSPENTDGDLHDK